MSEDNGNQRLTVAVLKTEIGHLRADLARFCEAMQKGQEDQDAKIGSLLEWKATAQERWASHERTHAWERGILGGLSSLMSIIAAWLGIRA